MCFTLQLGLRAGTKNIIKSNINVSQFIKKEKKKKSTIMLGFHIFRKLMGSKLV